MKSLKERLAAQEAIVSTDTAPPSAAAVELARPAIPTVDVGIQGANMAVMKKLAYREFDVARIRTWKYHNRNPSWLQRIEQQTLTKSIRESGQHTLGLVRAVEGVPGIDGEIVFGYRRSEACRKLGIKFRATVLPADTPDTECMALMHVENKESHDVSELEDARVYRQLLNDGIYANQTALAEHLHVSQGYISRLLSTTTIFDYDWLLPIIEPVMVDMSVRTAAVLAAGLKDPQKQRAMRNSARTRADTGQPIAANQLVAVLIGETGGKRRSKSEKIVLKKKGRSNVAVMNCDDSGNLSLSIVAHEQTDEERAALLEQIVKELKARL